MGISVRDRKLLWGRSRNRCAYEGCGRELLATQEPSGIDVVIGEEAHIVAREPDGPRGGHPLPANQRDAYPNLILLCAIHHTVIDADTETWTVERLDELKRNHEDLPGTPTSPDDHELALELFYAYAVDTWELQAELDNWSDWTSSLLMPTPAISPERWHELQGLDRWIFSRPWPGEIPRIEVTFENFRRVLNALRRIVDCAFEERLGMLRLRPHYKAIVDNPNYQRDLADFEWIVALVHDLTLELTRAGNAVAQSVRDTLDPLFRLSEGTLVVDRQGSGLYFEMIRTRYVPQVFDECPFRGLSDFTVARADCDVVFGEGENERAMELIGPVFV